MKKNLLLLLALILTIGSTWAQRPKGDQYAFTLNGNKLTPEANFIGMKEGMKAKFVNKAPAQLGWYIIQFNSIPTQKERKLLKSQGIELLNYIHGNAYFASLSSKFLLSETKSQKNLRALLVIKPEYKINQALYNDIPDFAKDGDMIKVVISYFKNVDNATLSSSSVKMKDKQVYKGICQIYTSITKDQLQELASLDWVQNIELVAPPAELDNRHGKSLHRSNVLNSTLPGLGYGLTGKGVTIGLWDADVYNHRDFNGRVTNREFESHTTDHGTHTCGTITSAGLLDPKALGMAPEAKVYAWNFNTQSNGYSVPYERTLSLDNDGIEITSNSWGYTVSTCPNPYSYNSTDQYEDLIACEYPYFLYVFSAGNNQDKCTNGYFTTSKNMKNSLMVAAVDQIDNMSSFSSFGPSYDGRLIPNISGDGVDVYSTFFDNGYGLMSGTSMATPGVAGTMALVYQRYKETHGGNRPLSAFMRALACNTAYDLGNPGPDYKYGYGEINGARAVEVMEQHNYFTDSVAQGGHYEKTITIPAGAVAVKVMLAWTDPYGVSTTNVLVNDLDLSLKNGSTTTLPWVLNPNNPSANAVRDYDVMNNMEQVTLDNPAAGTYTINVDGYAIAEGKQEFAVVYDIVMPTLKLTYPIGGEYLTPGDQEVVRWDCAGYDKTFTVEYSKDGGVNYSIIASNLPSNVRSYAWTVPSDITANARIRVSNGSKLSISKGSFMIMSVPKNVKVGQAQCGGDGPFTLQWDVVANAKYEVLKLHGQVYEHIAEVTTNSYDITGITQNNDNWYCVRSIDLTSGAVSERSLAVTVNPAVAVTSLPFKQDFESQKAPNFYFTSVKGQGNVRFVNTTNKYGIRLEGPSETTSTWVTDATPTCFTSNPNYVVTASICNIDATSMAGKVFRLKFDYRQKYRTAAGTSYFRVKVNGDYLANTEGTTIYGATNQVNYKSVYYDISAYAGLDKIKIEFEAVCKTNYTTYINSSGNYDFSNDTYDVGDFVTIDNIEVCEAVEDMSLTSLTAGTGVTSAEIISVALKNLSGVSISNIPVSYSVNGGATVSEVVPGPIAPMGTANYSFSQTADLSVAGYYTITASVNWSNDPVISNNSLTATKANNGTDVLIGTGSPTTTCSAVLTDPSGRYADYAISQSKTHTFVPGTSGKNIKVTFTEFATEPDYDFLYIYNGTSATTANLLGKYSGSSLPPTFTSTADGGELTFKFTSDNGVNDKGFIANIECVDKPNIDAAVTAITAPVSGINLNSTQTVTITLKNRGLQDLTNLDVYYQVNDGTPVHEVYASLTSLSQANYTFTTTADLSVAGSYTIKTWVAVTDDADVTNDSKTVTVVNSAATSDAGISAITDIIPYRTALSTIAATIKNFGTQSISNFDVAYAINGGAEVVQTYTGTITAGATATITFTTKANLETAGTLYSIDVYTKLVGDATATNDKMNYTVSTPTSSTTNVAGTFKTGNAIVTSSNTTQFSLTNNFTVELWMKPDKNPKYGTFFSKGLSIIHHSEYYPAVYGSNCLILSLGGQTYLTPSNSITNGVWQHVAVTSASDGTIKVYINGVQQTLSNSTKATQAANLTTPVRIGSNSTYSQPYYGSLDEVRVWTTERTQATIQANMMTNYVGDEANLVAYYKFIEGSGKYVYDYTSKDNTAIALNSDYSGTGAGKFWNEPGNLLTAMSVTGEKIPTTFDANTNTFNTIMNGVDLTSIAPNFTASQASVVKVGTDIQTSGVTTHDFTTGPVTYTVEGAGFNTGINQTYTLSVTNDLSSACDLTAYTFETINNPSLTSQIVLDANGNNFAKKLTSGTDISALKASFQISTGATLYINGVAQTNPQTTAVDYSKPLMVTVVAENGRVFKNYNIDLDARNSAASLTAFNIVGEQVGTAAIDQDNHSITIWVKNTTDLSMLASTFTVSPNATLYLGCVTQRSGLTVNDYSKPVTFSLVSEDESTTANWTVTVTNDVTKPEISLLGNATIEVVYGSTWTDPGVTANDNVDGDISSNIVVTGTVNTSATGSSFIVHYNVTDHAGNNATEVTRTVNIVKAPLTVTADNQTKVYGTNNPTLTIQYNGFITGESETNLATAPTASTTVDATTVVGSYTGAITVSGGVSDNYSFTYVAGDFSVTKATATVSITNLSQSHDGTAKPVTVTTDPAGLNVDVTYDGSTTVPINVGTYAVVATVNDVNYSGSNTATLTILPGAGVDPNDMNKVSIYSDLKNIYINIPSLKGDVKVVVFNIIGEQVYQSNSLKQGINKLEGNYNTGTYIVRAQINGKVLTQKVALQK